MLYVSEFLSNTTSRRLEELFVLSKSRSNRDIKDSHSPIVVVHMKVHFISISLCTI